MDGKEREVRVECQVGDPDANSSVQWNTAGIRDCWLDGSHHTAADRKIAEQILVGAPYLPYVVRVYRGLLRRLLAHMVEAGVRQFLDLGSGLPTASNVHEVVQALNPECRVVYVDIDAAVAAKGDALLAGNDRAVMVCEDLRLPAQVLDAAQRTGMI
ncbi:MAG: SAM-dependent methyltransferase, partial [Gammaproteobacteria bacterium]